MVASTQPFPEGVDMNEELRQRIERLERIISSMQMELAADSVLLEYFIEMMPKNKLQKLLQKYNNMEALFMDEDTDSEKRVLMDRVQFWREVMEETITEINAQNSSNSTD